MSRWIWHGWQSPEVKKLGLMNRPPPSRLSQGSLIQHFSVWLFTAKKMQLTLQSSRLPPPLSQLKWLTWTTAGRQGQGCPWPRKQNTSLSVTLPAFFLSISSLQPLPLFFPSLSSFLIPFFSSPLSSFFSCAQGQLSDISANEHATFSLK